MQFIDLAAQQNQIKDLVERKLKRVLNHGRYIMGPEVIELEEKLASYVGVKNCISCSSGTDALLMALMAVGIGKGDAVITTPFTYIATAEVISLLGATPIFTDINKVTYNIDPSNIELSLEVAKRKGLNPKAIIPVNLFGLPARYRIIKQISAENGLIVIEDAAQSFGSEIRGEKSCSFGDISTTSFFPAKPLGCYGDGGAIFTNDDEISKILKSIRNHGAGLNKYDNVRVGINGRLDTVQAAILLAKLTIFNNELKKRNQIAFNYNKLISRELIKPYIPKGYTSSWAQYSLVLPENVDRSRLMSLMKEKEIPTMVYYSIPLHKQKVFNDMGYGEYSLPISENISKRIFSLPMHPYLEYDDQQYISLSLNEIVENQ